MIPVGSWQLSLQMTNEQGSPTVSNSSLNPSSAPAIPRRRMGKRIIQFILGGLLLLVGLFVANGTLLNHGETPLVVMTKSPAAEPWSESETAEIKILSWNIAKCFLYHSNVTFDPPEVVRKRIAGLAELINQEQPDLVFLSETVIECGPCPVNQVDEIANQTGMHCWAFGENYNLGLPFYRIVGGNAILSRRPLEAVGNPPLAGRKPFYVTKNNRRMVWCATKIQGKRVLLSAVHTDSFKAKNNLAQTQQLIAFSGEAPSIMAGDFNAKPDEPSIELLRSTGRWIGFADEPLTFPADDPEQRIDFILAPATWELIEERVIDNKVSDHRPVVSRFQVKW